MIGMGYDWVTALLGLVLSAKTSQQQPRTMRCFHRKPRHCALWPGTVVVKSWQLPLKLNTVQLHGIISGCKSSSVFFILTTIKPFSQLLLHSYPLKLAAHLSAKVLTMRISLCSPCIQYMCQWYLLKIFEGYRAQALSLEWYPGCQPSSVFMLAICLNLTHSPYRPFLFMAVEWMHVEMNFELSKFQELGRI